MCADDTTSPTRTCQKCGRTLPATRLYFTADARADDKCFSWCISCAKLHVVAYRDARRVAPPAKVVSAQAKAAASPKYIRCSTCGKRKLATDANFKRSYYKGERRGLRKQCRACSNAKHLEWRKANEDRVRGYRQSEGYKRSQEAYNAEHYDEILARNAAWKKKNREACASLVRSRRASARGTHTAIDVTAQMDRQKGRCYWCGKKIVGVYHVDHVVPLAKGGSNGPENLVIACRTCNLSKGAKHPMDFAGRLL